jgi:hypothetical protein
VGSVLGSIGGGALFQAAPRLLFPVAGAIALAGAVSLTPVLRGAAAPAEEVLTARPGSTLDA